MHQVRRRIAGNLRVAPDHRQQYLRWTIRLITALLPIPHGGHAKSELPGEFRLAEAQRPPNLSNSTSADTDCSHAAAVVFAFQKLQCLSGTGQNAGFLFPAHRDSFLAVALIDSTT